MTKAEAAEAARQQTQAAVMREGGEMRERPILFSGPMVRSILDGRKTQTRRVARRPWGISEIVNGEWRPVICPYGQPGDLLWVRETFAKRYADAERDPVDGIIYRADGGCVIEPRWCPSIHMPRWASRLTLRITDVRLQRVREITDEEAISEGVQVVGRPELNELSQGKYIHAFKTLWDSINAKRGYSWGSNPYVWAISFEREQTARYRESAGKG